MAYFYSLAIECGEEPEPARACADHFAKVPLDQLGVAVDVDTRRSAVDQTWWAVVMPSDIDTAGDLPHTLTVAGQRLLERLRSAPPLFRFSVIGVEAYEAIAFAEFDEDLGQDATLPSRFSGLVVSEAILDRMGGRQMFQPFSPGYAWIPYRGERSSGS